MKKLSDLREREHLLEYLELLFQSQARIVCYDEQDFTNVKSALSILLKNTDIDNGVRIMFHIFCKVLYSDFGKYFPSSHFVLSLQQTNTELIIVQVLSAGLMTKRKHGLEIRLPLLSSNKESKIDLGFWCNNKWLGRIDSDVNLLDDFTAAWVTHVNHISTFHQFKTSIL
jgi:hypothetical protein